MSRCPGWGLKLCPAPERGERIGFENGALAVPDEPVIPFIEGDGVGVDVTPAMRQVLDAAVERAYGGKRRLAWWEIYAGEKASTRFGSALPADTYSALRYFRVGIKGPMTTPVGSGIRSLNVALRQELDLYACVRPVRWFEGVPAPLRHPEAVDMTIFRENTEDLYAGVEFEAGTAEADRLITFINELPSDRKIKTGGQETGISIKPISVTGSERIVRCAFDYARQNQRRKVTAVHKANIMKYSDGLFLATARRVAQDYPDIEFEDRIIDNMCMQLTQKPELYDVLVLPNLYGDIISDLGAGLVGGLGMAPGANLGPEGAVFEATHGSAPKYKGLNKVNPSALILSGMLMLRHLGETAAGDRLEQALAAVIAEGKHVTYDLKATRDDPSAVGTREMADAICARMR